MGSVTQPAQGSPASAAPQSRVIGPKRDPSPCCAHHPHVAPTNCCPRCGSLLCDACVTVRDVRGVVIEVCACGGVCEPLSAAEAGVAQEPFARHLAAAFSYPFAGQGRYLLAGGTAAVAVAQTLLTMGMSVGPIFGCTALLLSVILLGYVADYLMDVVVSTTRGGAEPPDWPDFFDPIGSLQGLGRLLVPAAVCFGPAYAAGRLFGSASIACWLLVLGGLLCFPMSLALSALLWSLLAGLSPRRVFRSIARLPRDYFAACGLFTVLLALLPCVLVGTGAVPWVGGLLGASAAFYLLIVSMRVIGLIGLVHARDLDLS